MNSVHARTETLHAPRQTRFHIIDSDDIIADRDSTAAWFAAAFRRELDHMEMLDDGPFSSLRCTYLDRMADHA